MKYPICPNCKSDHTIKKKIYDTGDIFGNGQQKDPLFVFLVCKNCGVMFLDPKEIK